MTLSHQEVRAILPHRHPILMVDRVIAREKGRTIHAIKNVSRNEPCFRGTGSKFYPRSLTLESFLQAGGILCYDAWSERIDVSRCAMLFVGLSGFSWRREVPAGCQLHHHAEIDVLMDAAAIYRGEIRIDNEIVGKIDQVTVAIRPVDALSGDRS